MKNVLSYYYHLHLDNIHQVDGTYRFMLNGNSYAFLIYNRDFEELNDLYKLSINLFNQGILCHQFIFNKEQQLITYVNQKPYVLLQLYHDSRQLITIEEIKKFNFFSTQIEKPDRLKRNRWSTLWSKKIDYFEYQVNQFGKKNPLIRESFSYFTGIVENGISLFETLPLDDLELSVCHRRIQSTETAFDFYNPLNFIIDYKVRDACEFFKTKITNKHILTDITNYLSDKNLNGYEILLFYDRLLYPSFYFDKYEWIMDHQTDDYELKTILQWIPTYEDILKKLFLFLSNYMNMPDIEWIKKTSIN